MLDQPTFVNRRENHIIEGHKWQHRDWVIFWMTCIVALVHYCAQHRVVSDRKVRIGLVSAAPPLLQRIQYTILMVCYTSSAE